VSRGTNKQDVLIYAKIGGVVLALTEREPATEKNPSERTKEEWNREKDENKPAKTRQAPDDGNIFLWLNTTANKHNNLDV